MALLRSAISPQSNDTDSYHGEGQRVEENINDGFLGRGAFQSPPAMGIMDEPAPQNAASSVVLQLAKVP